MEDELNEPERDDEETSRAADSETKSAISADLIRGHINTIILRTLYERDKYGYEIIEEIESKSHGQYTLKQPTLYSALKRLESQGYINAYWKNDEVSQGGRRKYYTLTDSGREIAEKNQAEWEYSRTVIDSLISDRNFDFTQPPPSAVDFKILKSSTSRVPVQKDDEDEEAAREVKYDEPDSGQVVEIKHEDVTEETVTEAAEPQTAEPEEPETIRRSESETLFGEAVAESGEPQQPQMSDEQRNAVHENYLRLISEPVEEQPTEQYAPYADEIDTERLIYNSRPETERDYRNLVNNLFMNTVRQPAPQPAPQPVQISERTSPRPVAVTVENVKAVEAESKKRNDGLVVETSDYSVGPRRKKYNRGEVLFKCSLIVGVLMLLEFALTLIFRKELHASVAYPFVILALAVAEVLIFGALNFTGVCKSTRKPTSLLYLSACTIVCVISILIIFLVSILIGVNFTSAGDIMAKIVIPCFIALNIPIFAIIFYLLSK